MKISHTPLLLAAFTLCMIVSACQSSSQKHEMQQAQALYVAHKSNKSQTDIAPTTQNDPIVAEWETLRATSEAKIKNNELMIGELKLQMKRIATLERHNRDLQIRLDTYQQSKGDWEIFRRAFTSDMEELRKGLKELTLDRKK